MQLSSRAGNEAKPNSDKVNAALALSTLWDNRQLDKWDQGGIFAGSSAASKKNESSQGGNITRIDTIGELMSNGGKLNTMKSIIPEQNGTETGLEALVMEHGMKRRKSIYEEVKALEKRDLDFIINLKKNNIKNKPVNF